MLSRVAFLDLFLHAALGNNLRLLTIVCALHVYQGMPQMHSQALIWRFVLQCLQVISLSTLVQSKSELYPGAALRHKMFGHLNRRP